MITILTFIIKILSGLLRLFSSGLNKMATKKYKMDKPIADVKMKKNFYKCGKCSTLIDLRTAKWEYCTTGRKTKCPKCNMPIVRQIHPEGYKVGKPCFKPVNPHFPEKKTAEIKK